MKSLQFYIGNCLIGRASIFYLNDGIYLANFFIKPEFRRQGHGKQIVKFLIFLYHVDTLIVEQSNYPAYFLYKKCGFEIKCGYYAPDMNADVYYMKRVEVTT